MPLVYINMMKGREEEKIAKMVKAVSVAISESLDAPIDSVRIMINEMDDHQYSIGGKTMAEVRAERNA